MTKKEADNLCTRVRGTLGYSGYVYRVELDVWWVRSWRTGGGSPNGVYLESPEEFPGKLHFEALK